MVTMVFREVCYCDLSAIWLFETIAQLSVLLSSEILEGALGIKYTDNILILQRIRTTWTICRYIPQSIRHLLEFNILFYFPTIEARNDE